MSIIYVGRECDIVPNDDKTCGLWFIIVYDDKGVIGTHGSYYNREKANTDITRLRSYYSNMTCFESRMRFLVVKFGDDFE